MYTSNFIWLDLEMTGLCPEQHVIVEIASIITDHNFNIIAEGPSRIIHQSETILQNTSPVAKQMHIESGLWDQIPKSQFSIEDAEKETLEFIKQYVKPGVSPMCGNTISQDRRFLKKFMPTLESFFHYRHLDISSFKIIYETKSNHSFSKKTRHRALDDIKESIDELKFYMKHLFKL